MQNLFAAITLVLALAPCAAFAQSSTNSDATKSPTAGIDKPPRSLSSMQFSRTGGADATGVGGFVGIPASNGTVVVPMNPGGGGNQPPPPAPPPPATPQALTGGNFAASSNYSHNARAWIQIFIRADGTCSVVTNALKSPGQNKTYSCGTWLPSGGSPGSYEVQFVAVNPVLGNGNPLYFHPYYTATTGWLSLSTDQSAIADTSMVVGGGSPGSGTASVEVDFYVRIRAAGASSYVESGPFSLFAEAEAF